MSKMRSRIYTKNTNITVEEVELSKLKEEPQLSGAFIRSLVRHLSSSRTKDSHMNSSCKDVVGNNNKRKNKLSQNLQKDDGGRNQEQLSRSQKPKKQARRRFHTSRPYQERILNMAEARREIVAALKFHRATMKKTSEQQQEQQKKQQQSEEEEEAQKEVVPVEIPSCLSWLSNSISPVSMPHDFTNLVLPKPPLGLNLNLDNFENLQTTTTFSSTTTTTTSIVISTCSSSSSLSSSLSSSSRLIKPTVISEATSEPRSESSSLHPVMDEREMEEIRSICEKHSMEWNDSLNSFHSAWWCNNKFLNPVESDSSRWKEFEGADDGFGLDETMGIPPWLCDHRQQLDDCFMDSAQCFEEPTLPCLDIGEFEGIDSEWLL